MEPILFNFFPPRFITGTMSTELSWSSFPVQSSTLPNASYTTDTISLGAVVLDAKNASYQNTRPIGIALQCKPMMVHGQLALFMILTNMRTFTQTNSPVLTYDAVDWYDTSTTDYRMFFYNPKVFPDIGAVANYEIGVTDFVNDNDATLHDWVRYFVLTGEQAVAWMALWLYTMSVQLSTEQILALPFFSYSTTGSRVLQRLEEYIDRHEDYLVTLVRNNVD